MEHTTHSFSVAGAGMSWGQGVSELKLHMQLIQSATNFGKTRKHKESYSGLRQMGECAAASE